jgi:glycosyltransferase involved in cell wall biosynthesis
MPPLVSVIVPVFNRFHEADRAIRSVFNQTYDNWELILIDDSSLTPYRPSIEYNINKVTLIRNEINIGPGMSRQKGLEISRGGLVCFLDSDDYYAPEFLEKSVRSHSQFPDVRATYTTAYYIHSNQIRLRSDLSFEEIVPTLLTGSRPWPTCGLLWKNREMPKWRSIRTNQDYMFELDNAMINNKIKHIPEVLCFIDKGTESNTDDLVSENERLINRNIVYQFALGNYDKFKVVNTPTFEIKKKAVQKLLFSSDKLLKYGNARIIWQNLRILAGHDWVAAMILAPVLVCSFSSVTRRVGSFFLRKSIECFERG